MVKRLTTEEFIDNSNKIHNYKYNYSKADYVNNRKKIIIICPEHGVFKQIAGEHLRGRGCRKCAISARKYSNKQFIKEAKLKHKDKYDYSKTNYINCSIKVLITCPEHGDFIQRTSSHLAGSGCPACANNIPLKSEFLKKAKNTHGDKYDYSKVNYVNSRTDVEIICSVHGSFFQHPNRHIQGSGCSKCMSVSYTLTLEEFIERANKIHNKKYGYSKANYINSNTKIVIICPRHGEFLQKPNDHLGGHGCSKCAFEKNSKKRILGKDKFIKKAIEIHGNKFKYDKVEYKNNSFKIVITCPRHGDFLQSPSGHLSGYGCSKCGIESGTKKRRYTIEQFVEKANKVHNNKYDYSKTKYKNALNKVEIICPKHGEFFQKPGDHLFGHGCPKCKYFKKVSKKSQLWLDGLGIPQKYREHIITLENRNFVVDGYDPKTKTIYEFNGDFWHGNPEKFNPDDINPINGIAFGKLYKKTVNRRKLLKSNGYKVISIWEDDFDFS